MNFQSQPLKHFGIALGIILLLSSPLLFMDKTILTFWLNERNTPFFDILFKYLTYLGSGWVLLPLFLVFLSRNYFMSLLLVVSALLESVLVQMVLKHGIFDQVARPIKYIANSDVLHRVAGVEIHTMHSFPSGHTQTAFLFFTFLALFCKTKAGAYFLLLVAVFVGLSRVYLLQHFFIDIWFGSLIGYSIPVLLWALVFKRYSWPQSAAWQRGLLKK